VLFCCGAQAYNAPIAQWAELVVNASRRLSTSLLTTSQTLRAKGLRLAAEREATRSYTRGYTSIDQADSQSDFQPPPKQTFVLLSGLELSLSLSLRLSLNEAV
jgi:hypothetical protein